MFWAHLGTFETFRKPRDWSPETAFCAAFWGLGWCRKPTTKETENPGAYILQTVRHLHLKGMVRSANGLCVCACFVFCFLWGKLEREEEWVRKPTNRRPEHIYTFEHLWNYEDHTFKPHLLPCWSKQRGTTVPRFLSTLTCQAGGLWKISIRKPEHFCAF